MKNIFPCSEFERDLGGKWQLELF